MAKHSVSPKCLGTADHAVCPLISVYLAVFIDHTVYYSFFVVTFYSST